MAPIQSLAQLIKSAGPDFGHDRWLAPNDHLRDFESNRRYKNRPARERIFPTVLLTWRKCTREKCCDCGFGKFWKGIEGKQMISNVLEEFDGVDKLSCEQTSGVFNFIQRK